VVRNKRIADNQAKFNQLTADGMSKESAAKQTRDAQQIMKAGYSKLDNIEVTGQPENYTRIEVWFTK